MTNGLDGQKQHFIKLKSKRLLHILTNPFLAEKQFLYKIKRNSCIIYLFKSNDNRVYLKNLWNLYYTELVVYSLSRGKLLKTVFVLLFFTIFVRI